MSRKIKIVFSFLAFTLLIYSYVFASMTSYNAEEYIIKINNINEEIERIDLIQYEKCDLDELGWEKKSSVEEVELYGDETITHRYDYDTENYYIDQIVRYNYLAGKAATDIEHVVHGGEYIEYDGQELVTYDVAKDERYKTKEEFEIGTLKIKDHKIICAKTIEYKAYRITPIKEINVSEIKSSELVYKHDDLTNLNIGIRIKLTDGKYKTFIPMGQNGLWMNRGGYKPILDKEKIIIFDYSEIEYESNANYSFNKAPVEDWVIILSLIIIVTIILLIIVCILNAIIKKKKTESK